MILLSSVLTSTIWSWYLQESDYSITNLPDLSASDIVFIEELRAVLLMKISKAAFLLYIFVGLC